VRFADGQRQVRLREGELIADVRTDAQAPFTVRCDHGSVQTLPADGHNTRFLLRQEDSRSLVATLQGSVALTPGSGSRRGVALGESVWFGPAGIEAARAAAADAAAWQGGHVAVYDQPLGEVIAALRPYRRGFLRISPEASALRVYGSYPLDDTDRALATIGETLPVVMRVHSGGWLVRIDAA
jgi:transmembrane sensor